MDENVEDIELKQTEFNLLREQLRFLFRKKNRLEQKAKEIQTIMTTNVKFIPFEQHKDKTENMLNTLLGTGEGDVEEYLKNREHYFKNQLEIMPMINRMEQIGIDIKSIIEDIQEIEKKFSKLSGDRYVE
jgi:DNA repair ATPase RecN